MTKFKYNRLLIVCIIIGLIAAIGVNIQRNSVEKANMTVDLAIDYEDMKMIMVKHLRDINL